MKNAAVSALLILLALGALVGGYLGYQALLKPVSVEFVPSPAKDVADAAASQALNEALTDCRGTGTSAATVPGCATARKADFGVPSRYWESDPSYAWTFSGELTERPVAVERGVSAVYLATLRANVTVTSPSGAAMKQTYDRHYRITVTVKHGSDEAATTMTEVTP